MGTRGQRDAAIDFSRACCALGIVVFHFFCHSNSGISFLHHTANGEWGDIFVTAFFALSGTVLFYNYAEGLSPKEFYFRRWRSIFPQFYLCWAFFFLSKVIRYRRLFYNEDEGAKPISLLLTLFGVDGYFQYRIPDYYIVGEWFLGAILMLYLLFPLLLRLMKRNVLIVPAVLLCGMVAMKTTDFFVVSDFRNMITCAGSFYFGMVAAKYRERVLRDKRTAYAALLLFALLCGVKTGRDVAQLQGLLFYVASVHFGSAVMKTRAAGAVAHLSGISFPIFLFQHMVILAVFKFRNPADFRMVLPTLGAVVLVTVLAAELLSRMNRFLLSSRAFKSLERRVCAQRILRANP